jgi:lipopolysaccharide transport system permease protein
LAEFAVSVGVFLILATYYAFNGAFEPVWRWELSLLPLLFLLTILFAIGIGMVVGVLSLVARDVLYTLPYFLQAWMLFTPVIYTLDFVPSDWRWLFYIVNPMATVVEIGRTVLIGGSDTSLFFIAVASVVVFATLAVSTAFFLRAEDVFMDDI